MILEISCAESQLFGFALYKNAMFEIPICDVYMYVCIFDEQKHQRVNTLAHRVGPGSEVVVMEQSL